MCYSCLPALASKCYKRSYFIHCYTYVNKDPKGFCVQSLCHRSTSVQCNVGCGIRYEGRTRSLICGVLPSIQCNCNTTSQCYHDTNKFSKYAIKVSCHNEKHNIVDCKPYIVKSQQWSQSLGQDFVGRSYSSHIVSIIWWWLLSGSEFYEKW